MVFAERVELHLVGIEKLLPPPHSPNRIHQQPSNNFVYTYYPIAIFSLNLFQRSVYTFSHVFRNQNFEPVPSKHFKHTHAEY